MKAANKGAKAPAELPEGRASTKGNSQDQSTYRTQGRVGVSQAVERIRQAATRKPQEKLTALLHHITTDALRCAFYDLKKTASAGVDGLVWTGYEDGLEERLLDLHGRVHSGAYRALPSRRVEIPKPDGGTRPLGIAALEDKIVQKAVVDVILTPLYEPEFLGFSYGFRPGRGAHDALDALAFGIERRKRRPETFDFLGFTHYCKKKRNGNFGLGRKPIAKRVTRTLKRVKEKLRERMHEDVHDTAQWLGRVVNGWLNYYAVPTSARALRGFARRLLWIWLRTLRGRSQKDRTTIAGVARLAALYWPPVKVRHPWPTERFAVSHPR